VTPIRSSLRASSFAALLLTALALVHVFAVLVFVEGCESGADLMGKVSSQLPPFAIFFVVAVFGWFLGVAPELPPPPSPIRGVLVAGLWIPTAASLVFSLLESIGLMRLDQPDARPDDDWTRFGPALAYLLTSGITGWYLTRRRDRAASRATTETPGAQR